MNEKIIRFRRKGSFYLPMYDIIVCFRSKRARGNFIERIGFFHPIGEKFFFINGQRLGIWLNRGAKLHPTVRKYLINLVEDK
jgi:ribosomal protein S16